MKRLVLKALLVAFALAAGAGATAQDIKERTLKLGLQNPKGHPVVMGAEKFAEQFGLRREIRALAVGREHAVLDIHPGIER